MVGENSLGNRIGRRLLAAYAWAVIGFLLLPIFIVIPMSFNDASLFEVIPSKPSIKQYARLFASPDWLDVLFRSVRIALYAMAAATVLGTLAALGIAALRARARTLVEAAFIAPQIVPSVVIATAAYYVFAWLGMIGTTPAIVIAHSLLALPFVVVLVGSRLQSLSPELAQAIPVLLMVRGLGKAEGNRLIWDLAITDEQALVNGVDVMKMAGGGSPDPAPQSPPPKGNAPQKGLEQKPGTKR